MFLIITVALALTAQDSNQPGHLIVAQSENRYPLASDHLGASTALPCCC